MTGFWDGYTTRVAEAHAAVGDPALSFNPALRSEVLRWRDACWVEPKTVECRECEEQTANPSGTCYFCEGWWRPVCRICGHEAPYADWSAHQRPRPHKVKHGSYKGEWCLGSLLPVALIE